MTLVSKTFELYGKTYTFESGELAKQATGAVLVTCGATSVLVTAVVSSQEKDYDFFPLTVDYIEKMYAVGRIPGGYLKREAKPSDHGTLVARMVDRPIRPGFPDGYKNEVHIVATPFVIDGENLPDTICVAGASAALLVGGAPFDGPAACVRIGRDIETGEFIVNPTVSEQENSDLELTIAGTADYISMVEAGAAEISEEDMLAAMTFGQEAIAAFCEKQAAFLAKVNPTPMDYTIHAADPSVAERVDAHLDEMSAALKDADKAARMQKVEELKSSIIENDFTEEERAAWGSDIKAALKALEKRAMRAMILETGERVDGRTPEEIRPLYIVPGYLPRVHGSGLFQRGQGAFRPGDRFFVPARQIAQVEDDGLHGASDQFRQAVMAGKMEPDGRGEQPFLLQTLPGGADGFFLHVKGVPRAGRASQPGQENRIMPVARRGVHDCVPGEDDTADPVMSAGHGAAEQGTDRKSVV